MLFINYHGSSAIQGQLHIVGVVRPKLYYYPMFYLILTKHLSHAACIIPWSKGDVCSDSSPLYNITEAYMKW